MRIKKMRWEMMILAWFFLGMASVFAESVEIKFKDGELLPAGWHLDPLPADWQVMDLMGDWRFLPAKEFFKEKDEFTEAEKQKNYWAKDFGDSAWLLRHVPRSWSYYRDDYPQEKHEMLNEGIAYYRQKVKLPEQLENKRVLLYLYGIRHKVTVWVNSQEAGTVEDGTSFLLHTLDITGFVKAGSENTIVLRAYSGNDKDFKGESRLRGIIGPVRLIITPEVYASKILVDPDLAAASVRARCVIHNPLDKAVELKLKAVVRPEKGGTEDVKEIGVVKLEKGDNNLDLTIPLKNPQLWSPENPHLYLLSLADEKGRSLGLARFGYRQFTQKGKHLYLNGERIRLRGGRCPTYPSIHLGDKKTGCVNEYSDYNKILLFLKQANHNCSRTSQYYDQTILNLADETGFLYYFELPEIYRKKLEFQGDILRRHVEQNYNHPSVAIWCFGNEEYESWFPGVCGPLNKAYELTKAIEKSGRPVSAASGLDVRSEHIPKTDIADVHVYGDETARRNTLKIIRKRYGEDMPFFIFEANPGGYLGYWYNRPRGYDEAKYKLCDMFKNDPGLEKAESRKTFAEALNDNKTKHLFLVDWMEYWCGGFRKLFTWDDGAALSWAGESLLANIDTWRRDNELEGFSIGNWGILDLRDRTKEDKTKVFAQPAFYACQTGLAPEYVCVQDINYHPFADSVFKFTLRVVNDSVKASAYTVAVRLLRVKAGEKMQETVLTAPLTDVCSSSLVEGEIKLPASLASGDYTLSLTLKREEQSLVTRDYRLWILNKADIPKKWPTAKIALYDKTAELFAGIEEVASTANVLKKMGVVCEPVKDFGNLGQYEVLIIGCNSLDDKVREDTDKIRAWLEAGGRLVCFEQSVNLALSWAPQINICPTESTTWVDPLAVNHPIFKDIADFRLFINWNQDKKTVCENILRPVNSSLLAIAPSLNGYGLAVSEMKMGKGVFINSQLKASSCFEQDSVAARFLANVLQYGLGTNESVYAASAEELQNIPVRRVMNLDIDHAAFIDLRPYVNRGFRDEMGGDQKGGWADYGAGGDIRDIPFGRQRFSMVWFEIIDPAGNNDKSCIVLSGKAAPGAERLYFPREVKGIKIGRPLLELYFLHTAMHVTKDYKGKVLLRYRLHYEDGSSAEFAVQDGRDIADWHKPADESDPQKALPNGLVVYLEHRDGLFLSTWKNPYPDKKIATMDIISEELAVPIVIGISGRTYKGSVN